MQYSMALIDACQPCSVTVVGCVDLERDALPLRVLRSCIRQVSLSGVSGELNSHFMGFELVHGHQCDVLCLFQSTDGGFLSRNFQRSCLRLLDTLRKRAKGCFCDLIRYRHVCRYFLDLPPDYG